LFFIDDALRQQKHIYSLFDGAKLFALRNNQFRDILGG